MTVNALEPDDVLAPEPARLTGALIGYARVSTRGQKLDRQLHALSEAGCLRTWADKKSGRDADRPELAACLDYLRPGDVLVVPSLDRLARSLQDLITIVGNLRRRGVGFRSLHEVLDTTTPGGRLVFHIFGALAEFLRELIVEGTHEGLAAARARGTRLGRPPALNAEQISQARTLLTRPEESVSSIARLLGVSRSTIYKHMPDLAARRAPAAIAELPAAAAEHSAITGEAASVEVDTAPVRRGLECPCCGHRPVTREDAVQQRDDLTLVWLRVDEHGHLAVTHHCTHCAPAGPVTDPVACVDCADGPLLVGRHDTTPPAVMRWLRDTGWELDPEPVCPACQT